MFFRGVLIEPHLNNQKVNIFMDDNRFQSPNERSGGGKNELPTAVRGSSRRQRISGDVMESPKLLLMAFLSFHQLLICKILYTFITKKELLAVVGEEEAGANTAVDRRSFMGRRGSRGSNFWRRRN